MYVHKLVLNSNKKPYIEMTFMPILNLLKTAVAGTNFQKTMHIFCTICLMLKYSKLPTNEKEMSLSLTTEICA